MSFFTVKVTLPRTAELTICARDEQAARWVAAEFVETAFANALDFWSNNEPITDGEGRPIGEVQIEMPNEGMIELASGAVEIVEDSTVDEAGCIAASSCGRVDGRLSTMLASFRGPLGLEEPG